MLPSFTSATDWPVTFFPDLNPMRLNYCSSIKQPTNAISATDALWLPMPTPLPLEQIFLHTVLQ